MAGDQTSGDSNLHCSGGSTPEDGQTTCWPDLLRRIHEGDENAASELYAVFNRGIRFLLKRQLAPEHVNDKVHDVFLIVLRAIKSGAVREPERIMGYVRTVVNREVTGYIDERVRQRREQSDLLPGVELSDTKESPEELAVNRERQELVQTVLKTMSARDRELLTRFYLQEQSPERICEEMGLTDTQFRLMKSRAKARFGQLGQRKLRATALSRLFPRSLRQIPCALGASNCR